MKSVCHTIRTRTGLLFLLAVGLFAAAYTPVFKVLGKTWLASDEYSHAFFVLPIVGYIVWKKRKELISDSDRSSWLGLILVLCSTPLFMFSLVTNVNTLIAITLMMTMTGAVIYLGGLRAARELFTPLLLLAMLIPIPDQLYIKLTFPLQLKVSQISEVVLRLFSVPILREGNLMTTPGKIFQVVEACSGLRSLIALLTLSVIMGYFLLKRPASKVLLAAVSVPAAIFVNMVRVVTMILMFHFFRFDLTEGTLHTVTGLMLFTIALLILFLMFKVLEHWETRPKKS